MEEKNQFSIGEHVPRILVRRQLSGGVGAFPVTTPGSPLLKVSFNGQTFDLPRDGSIHVKRSSNPQIHTPSVGTSMASGGTPHASVFQSADGKTRIHFEQRGGSKPPMVRSGSGARLTTVNIPVIHQQQVAAPSAPQQAMENNNFDTQGCRDSGYSSAFADFEKMFEKFSDESKQKYIVKISSPVGSPQGTHKKVVKSSSAGGRLFSDDLLEDETDMSHTEKLEALRERLEMLKSQFSTDDHNDDDPNKEVVGASGYCKYVHDDDLGDLELNLDDDTNSRVEEGACSLEGACVNSFLSAKPRTRPQSSYFRKTKSEENTLCSRTHSGGARVGLLGSDWYRTAPPGCLGSNNTSEKVFENTSDEALLENESEYDSEPELVLEKQNQVQFNQDKFAALQKKVERLKLDEEDIGDIFSNGWCDQILTARTRRELGLDIERSVCDRKPSLYGEDVNSNSTDLHEDSCADCGYTCHQKCQKSVTLQCSGGATGLPPEEETALHDPPDDRDHLSVLHSDRCETDSGYSGSGGKGERTLTKEDLQRSIWLFNERFPNLGMTMPDSENTFHGFIHVNMNLSRPINMRVSPRPPSIYDIMQHELAEEDFKTKILSFYLPKDTLKALHISSKTTAQEVIEVLLNKFKITDNPRKFALYEQTLEKSSEVRLRKILDSEHPLMLCLNWGSDISGRKRFVLQENETGEIMWEAFSVPELHNFLKILELEEGETLKEIRNKFKIQKKHMMEIMKEHEDCRAKSKERT